MCLLMNKQENYAVDSQRNRPRQLHCPSCGSTNFTASPETSIKGGEGISMPIMGVFVGSSFTISNSLRNFWLCQNCGHKFLNLQDLMREIAKAQAENKKTILCAAFLPAIWIFVVILVKDFSAIRNIFTVTLGAAELYAVIKFVFGKKKLARMIEDICNLELR